ncbi:hypothetical protein V8B97DRAFT_1981637 [Scleroderma yunnanense]
MVPPPFGKRKRRSSSSASTETVLRTDSARKKACAGTIETTFLTDPAENVPCDSTGNILRMDPAVARRHFDRIGRFRILVIGRSNAGKTTLLQRICNTTELPEVFNSEGKQRGEHNIEDELVFRSNTGFIFHDSRGFEAGSEKEVELMRNFLTIVQRIHAIWYCIPLTDSERPVVAAEELFFNECNTGNGSENTGDSACDCGVDKG